MKDYFGAEGRFLFFLEEQFARIAEQFGYQPLRTPLVEQAELFYKGVAEGDYVVQKEMYEFSDKGGRILALRPESTPSVVRAMIEHHFFGNSIRKLRVYYFGPMFRYDRPQKARYRLFHQVGVEAIGWKDPELDVEIIHLFLEYLRVLDIHSYSLILNTLGCTRDLSRYRQELSDFLQKIRKEFPEKEQQKIDRNPLRLLDSKDPDTRAVLENHTDLPKIFSFLCEDCQQHFQDVCRGLETLGWKYQVNPFLVRGLDYYTRTVFEVISAELGAQDSLGGGGRYDNLFSLYTGGKLDIPCVGFAAGVERLLALSTLQQKIQQ
ncbi:MAG: histidine--tRNA ligase, partial [bacterium]